MNRLLPALRVFGLCSFFAGSLPAHAETKGEKAVGRVDSVLDRLEKRLLDSEADSLSAGEKGAPAFLHEKPGKITQYQYGKDRVEGQTSEHAQVKGLSKAIAELEAQVDQLASNVQKTKQTILDEAKIDNYVAVEVRLAESDVATIKNLNVKLDGYPVYLMSDAAGLWMPTKIIPLYSGPLKTGAHRIDLEARIAMRHKTALPLRGDIYRFVNKTFEMEVPAGTVNSRYVISITPPESLDGAPEATMKEAS